MISQAFVEALSKLSSMSLSPASATEVSVSFSQEARAILHRDVEEHPQDFEAKEVYSDSSGMAHCLYEEGHQLTPDGTIAFQLSPHRHEPPVHHLIKALHSPYEGNKVICEMGTVLYNRDSRVQEHVQ